MNEIDVFLADLLKTQLGDEKPDKWISRLKSFFEERFGKDWLESYRELRDEVEKRYGPFDDL